MDIIREKKNKNIVLVFPRSLLVHHRLSSMITKSMIISISHGTQLYFIFHIYTFPYLTYIAFFFLFRAVYCNIWTRISKITSTGNGS